MRKIISITMVLAAVLFCMGSGSGGTDVFQDTGGHRAEESISKWSNLGVINGYNGNFRPDDYVTRGEMAAIINRIMRYTLIAENTFVDLGDAWYREPLLAAAAAGVFQGSDGYIRPEGNITREEAAAVFYRAFLAKRYFAIDEIRLPGASGWAAPELSAMYYGGYIDDEYVLRGLKDKLTRAEAVGLLEAVLGEVPQPEEEKDIQGNALLMHRQLTNVTITGDLLIPPGAQGVITLTQVIVLGCIFNYSDAEIVMDENSCGEVINVDIYEMKEGPPADMPEYLDYFGQQIPIQPGVPVFALDSAGFESSAGRVGFTGENGEAALGIDVSAWQKDIDWAKVKADGVEFAMLRVGFRGYESGSVNVDKYFHQNAVKALENGIDIGVYFFSQATTPQEAVVEAELVLELIAQYDITYPVCFDWEMITEAVARTDGLAKETVTACAVAFCETVKAAGYIPAVYIYTETAYFCYDLTQICSYDLWFAKYAAVPQFYYDFQIWQFTDSGSVDGINGKVDMNLSLKRYK